jgi:DNA-directed RNA polymerase specialized sigma24 family protein
MTGRAMDEPRTSLTLVSGLKAQEADSWRRFSLVYHDFVYQRCLKDGLQPADAADVTQEVLLALLRNTRQFDPTRRLRPYLMGILKNKLADCHAQIREEARAAGGIRFVERFTGKLHWLHLGDTLVTDAGIRSIASLSNLELLEINSTSVTDRSVEALSAWRK